MKASSPEMETTWPRSSSPCSGVLKFRLASNASANVASADSLAWVVGLFDPFREVDLGPRDRLGSVSYSKAFTRAMRTEVARRTTSARRISFPKKDTAEAAKKLRAALARAGTRTYIEGSCRAGCFIADVNGAGGRNERRWSSWRCDADASLRLSTRRDRCDGQRTSGRVDSNALWWLSTDRERARETRDRGPLGFECRMANAECRMTAWRVLHSAFSILHSSPSASIAHR